MANMIVNPGFEEDPITVEDGGFWVLRFWGVGPPTVEFTVETTDVFEGLRAVRCHVVDPAGCQFVVGQYSKGVSLNPTNFVPGKEYQIRVAYKSDMPLTLSLEISDPTGIILNPTMVLPASPTWTQSPWLTFVFPAGVTWIQWFVMNNWQVGDFLVDLAELIQLGVPAQWNVTVDSTPIIVPVTVDSSLIGNTPVSVSLAEGSHSIQLPMEVQA